MDKISVLIPTYKSVDALNLCLKSVIGGCSNLHNIQVIVGVDGTYDLNKHVLDKFQDNVELLILEENVGLCRMTNLLVYNASHDLILILNDDNVVDEVWDLALLRNLPNNSVITPNQIEPAPSIFRQFHITDHCGKNIDEFDLDKFYEFSENVSENTVDETGSTLPIFMNKTDYLRVGGWDETYPQGMVADCDFFLKCRLSGMKMLRTYNCHVYHFASLSVNGEKRQQAESAGHEYFKYKWGNYMKRDTNNNIYI